MSTTEKAETDFASAMAEEASIYERLGFKEEGIAIGIDPEEVLKYLGTRSDLIKRFVDDNPKFDEAKAAEEVDKFMLDAEMVSKFVAWEKSKLQPRNLRQEAEEQLSDPAVWATYAAWIGGGAGFAVVKNTIIEPKFASGEWTDVHINIGDFFHASGAVDSATAAIDSVAHNADIAVHTVDPNAVQGTLEAVAAVATDAINAVSKCVGPNCP